MTLARHGLKLGLIAPALAVGLMVSGPASAAGLGGLADVAKTASAAESNLIQVQARRRAARRAARANRRAARVYHRNRSRSRRRRNTAIGIGLGILGAAIIANHHYKRAPAYGPVRAYRGDGYRAAKRRCARTFRDYSWRTDLIYDGYRERLCPYVRRYY